MRHILVNSKSLADTIETQLKSGGDFAKLAKKYSKDPGSAAQGGKLTISKGQTVAPFDKVAFSLKTNETSPPVHTTYGWHIIQALSAVKPATQQPLTDVKASIQTTLLQTKKTDVINEWVDGVNKEFSKKISLPDRVHAALHCDDDGRDDDQQLALRWRAWSRPSSSCSCLTEQLRRECPWDREQTARTIVPHTVEEAYEVADAALADDDAKLLDELGDLLFQVYFLAASPVGAGRGDLGCRRARRAREARAPAPARLRRGRGGDRRAREGELGAHQARTRKGARACSTTCRTALPGLLYARKVQQRAKSVGFEYPDVAGAVADLDDELRELKDDLESPERRAEELGDVLFAAVNVARKLDVDPELELRRAADRFRARVETAERLAASSGENWSELPLEQQDRYFDLAKETTE